MSLKTRVTDLLQIRYPLLSAPMAFVSGGQLAAEVSQAGGLGLIGGSYSDDGAWLEAQLKLAGTTPIGVGFITWSLSRPENRHVLDLVLQWQPKPKAIMLSFGDIRPFVEKIKKHKIPLLVGAETVQKAKEMEVLGADIIVVQGTEAGGHGASEGRGTMALIPAVVDVVKVPVIAAGGLGDGRGVVAALALGASGALLGTRFYPCPESLAPDFAKQLVLKRTGDDTTRSSVIDVARQREWPVGFNFRTINTPFIRKWHGKEFNPEIKQEIKAEYKALLDKDKTHFPLVVGESIDLAKDVKGARAVAEGIIREAELLLTGKKQWEGRSKL